MKILNLTLGSILILGISAYEYIEPPSPSSLPSSQNNNQQLQTKPIIQQEPKIVSYLDLTPKQKQLIPDYIIQDQIRITQMLNLINLFKENPTSNEIWNEYIKLCNQANFPPKLGMTISEAHTSTWCFPYLINKTITKNGEYVQEVYYQKDANGDYSPNYSKRQYLYFENNILVSIQE